MMYRLMQHRRHLCWLRPVAGAVVVLIALAHPLIHQFEGGTLDMMIQYAQIWFLSLTGASDLGVEEN